jgi:hypothetical protein
LSNNSAGNEVQPNKGGVMKKILISVVLLAFLTTGCTGSFNLTRKVYNFHRSQSDKWADELCFLLVVLVPVYGIATFADAIVFNSVEFWTGDNPIEMTKGDTNIRIVKQGDEEMIVAYNTKTDEVIVTPKMNSGEKPTLVFERNNEMVLAKNDQGQTLYSSVKGEDGNINVYDGSGKLIKNYSAEEVESLKEKIRQN